MLVDCSNCHTPLNLPPGAKSIRCSICQAITRIADHPSPSGSNTLFHSLSFNDNQHVPSGYYVPPPPAPILHNYPVLSGGGGRKKAVIVGVSYKNTRHELKGCINDAKFMKHLLLTRFQFLESQIVMLTEEETDLSRIPTGRNMRMALSWLVNGCQPGDSLLFHFSGHGSRQKNRNGDEIDGYDETLCPLDFETEGMIIDDEVNAVIVRPLPVGVRLHAIIDSCHSGTVLDLPWLCRMNRAGQYEWEDHRPKEAGIWKGSSGGEVISISGCDDDQTSADTSALSKITSTGAMTFCFIEAIEHGNASTYGSLLSSMRNSISNASRGPGGGSSSFNMLLNGRRGFTQEPQLTSCEPFDIFAKPFSI
uniref:metacaspase-1-like n=1 Tax=Erigeron canadensis TaxID=72917 RepID=UPI001CB8B91D|nr:metacaspase-1-like [Erigeron canadensis]